MNKISSWELLPEPPVEIHIHDFNHNPEHPDTPAEVRDKKINAKSLLEGAVWSDEEFTGILLGTTEHTWETKTIREIILRFAKPAKGSGSVSITVRADGIEWPNEFITSSKKYSDSMLHWSRQVLSTLKNFGIKVSEIDMGYDA